MTRSSPTTATCALTGDPTIAPTISTIADKCFAFTEASRGVNGEAEFYFESRTACRTIAVHWSTCHESHSRIRRRPRARGRLDRHRPDATPAATRGIRKVGVDRDTTRPALA